MNLRIPVATIIRPYVARGMRLWLIVRIAVAVVSLLAAEMPVEAVLRYSLSGSLAVLASCALLGIVDTRRRKERALLANLGITDAETMAMFAVPAAAGELLLAFVLPW